MLAGIAVARLASAPYDSVWLGDIVASHLAQRSRGAAVDVGAVRVDLSGTTPTPLALLDVEIVSPDETILVVVPQVRVDTDLKGLLTGDFRVGAVKLMRPQIDVARADATGLLPSAADLATEADRAITAAAADFATFGVDAIRVEDATLQLSGALDRRFAAIDIDISPAPDSGKLRVDASVAGRAGRWNLRFRHGEEADGKGRWFTLAAADVTAVDFLPRDYPVRPGRGLGLPLYPQATFHLDEAGDFRLGEMRLGVGAGYIALQDDDAIFIDEMLLALSWGPEQPHVVLQPSYAVFGETRFAFHGQIRPPEPERDTWEFALEAPKARLRPRDVGGAPLIVDRILAFCSFDPEKLQVDLDTFNLRAGALGVTAAGSIEFGPDGPLMAAAVSSNLMTVAALKRLWPSPMSPETRSWFIRHAESGQFEDARLIIALDRLGFDGDPATVGWTPEGLRLDFSVEKGRMKTVGDLPVLRDMTAKGEIRNGRFTATVESARVVAPGGGEVAVRRGLFTVPDLRPEDKTGQLELTLSGSAADIARIANQKPVNASGLLTLDPEGLSGGADVTVSASFPLKREDEPVLPREVSWTVAATLDDFSSREPIAGQSIKNADLDVTANADAAILRGRGVLNGLPVEIDVVQPLAGGEGPRNQGLVVDFDASDLKARGIDLGGVVDGKLRLNVDTSAEGVRRVVADLTQARLHIPAIGWTKGTGVPAQARFTARENDGRQVIDDFVLTSDGVDVAGSLLIGRDGALQEADFERFALRASDSGRLSVTRTSGGYTIDLTARAFDGRGLIANLKRGAGGKGGLPDTALRFKGRIDRLTGFEGAAITSFSLDLAVADGRISTVDMSGLIDGRSEMSATLGASGGKRELRVDAHDAGGLFRFLDFYTRLKGGRAMLNTDLAAEGRSNGRLVVTDLAIAEDPALRQIVNADPNLLGSDSSPITRRRMLQRGDMSFQKLDVRFHKVADLVTIDSGALSGTILGGALEGTINLASQRVDLRGTFVPAYALNNLFGRIPVLGQLVGGRHGGLLGVTFRIGGTLETPVVSVNPMSAIAPGIFRKIFEFN